MKIEKEVKEIIINDMTYEETIVYRIHDDGTKEAACVFRNHKKEKDAVLPPTQLDRIEAKIQTNEDLQAFYDDIVKEVGL